MGPGRGHLGSITRVLIENPSATSEYGPVWSFFLHLSSLKLQTKSHFGETLTWRVNSRIYVIFATYLSQNDALGGYVVMLIVLRRTLLWPEEVDRCSGE